MIIGLTGKAGAGKDTVADYLVEKYGFQKISFASTLKQMLAIAGLPEPTNREDKEKKVEGFDFTWREAAQKLGTEWARNLDKDFWLKVILRKMEPDVDYVISDVRFDNEANFVIEELGGIVWEIIGREANLGDNKTHASEQGVSDNFIDTVILNDDTLEELYHKVSWCLVYDCQMTRSKI